MPPGPGAATRLSSPGSGELGSSQTDGTAASPPPEKERGPGRGQAERMRAAPAPRDPNHVGAGEGSEPGLGLGRRCGAHRRGAARGPLRGQSRRARGPGPHPLHRHRPPGLAFPQQGRLVCAAPLAHAAAGSRGAPTRSRGPGLPGHRNPSADSSLLRGGTKARVEPGRGGGRTVKKQTKTTGARRDAQSEGLSPGRGKKPTSWTRVWEMSQVWTCCLCDVASQESSEGQCSPGFNKMRKGF